ERLPANRHRADRAVAHPQRLPNLPMGALQLQLLPQNLSYISHGQSLGRQEAPPLKGVPSGSTAQQPRSSYPARRPADGGDHHASERLIMMSERLTTMRRNTRSRRRNG